MSLSRRDYRVALDFVAALGEAADLDDFAARVAFGLAEVIPCDAASYNEINRRRSRARWVTGIDTGPEDVALFEHFLGENPFILHFAAHPMAEAVRVGDLVGPARWRDLGVYRDFYRPLGCERILAVEVSPEPIEIAVAAFRDGGDFSGRDRSLLTLLRPHLANAYRNAALLTDFAERLALFERGFAVGSIGAVLLRADGRIETATDTARAWLADCFGRPDHGDILPEPVLAWLAANDRAAADGLPAGEPRLVSSRGDRRLVLSLVRHRGRRLLLLQQRHTAVRPEALAALGLARRESEVLALAAGGKTDAEIAAVLAISPRTVSHTLEHVYRKLGVAGRTAAAMRAVEAVAAARV